METKQIIVIRKDKENPMSQVAQTSISALLKLFTIEEATTLPGGFCEPGQKSYLVYTEFGLGTVLQEWLLGKLETTIKYVESEAELLDLYERLQKESELEFCPLVLIDNTCLGIGPYSSEILDKHLP